MIWSRSSRSQRLDLLTMRQAGRPPRTWLLAMALGGLGCAGSQEPAGMGKDCYRDEDCKVGLVCVANAARNRVCTNDVTSLDSSVPGPPPEAGAPPGAAGAP